MDKNAWYLIEWEFDSNDKPYIKEQTQPLNFLDDNGEKILSKQLEPHEPATYLGITSQVNGSQTDQYRKLMQRQSSVRANYPPHTFLIIILTYI